MKRVKSDDVRCGGDLGPPSFLLWEVFRRVLVKLFISFWMRNACNIKADGAVFSMEIPETGFLFSPEIHCCEDFSTKK